MLFEADITESLVWIEKWKRMVIDLVKSLEENQ